ncbi:VOC family protein [Desulfosporosinus sp. SB140]|uniref:VOC family protein n=1 Tax=Desulfosporosinus paludis TaxID=3115649 RepID=UPI00388E363C
MINKFGKVMVYVKDPQAVADFWTEKIGFTEVGQQEMNNQVLSIELAPNETSDCHLVLFNRAIVEEMSGGISLETPSILFGSYDIDTMRSDLIAKGVTVGEIMEMSSRTFNFADVEGNYFAVEEINS